MRCLLLASTPGSEGRQGSARGRIPDLTSQRRPFERTLASACQTALRLEPAIQRLIAYSLGSALCCLWGGLSRERFPAARILLIPWGQILAAPLVSQELRFQKQAKQEH